MAAHFRYVAARRQCRSADPSNHPWPQAHAQRRPGDDRQLHPYPAGNPTATNRSSAAALAANPCVGQLVLGAAEQSTIHSTSPSTHHAQGGATMSFFLNPPLKPRNGKVLQVLGIARISTKHQDVLSLADQEYKYRRWLDQYYGQAYELTMIAG